jgi:hypothetical protein
MPAMLRRQPIIAIPTGIGRVTGLIRRGICGGSGDSQFSHDDDEKDCARDGKHECDQFCRF